MMQMFDPYSCLGELHVRQISIYLIHILPTLYDGVGPHLESFVRPCNVYALSIYC